jgi:hypothetical protein
VNELDFEETQAGSHAAEWKRERELTGALRDAQREQTADGLA